MRTSVFLLVSAACGSSGGLHNDAASQNDGLPRDSAPDACSTPPAPVIDCSTSGCAAISVAGDSISSGAGTFHGFADPGLATDPATGRVWLAYSWPHLVQGTGTNNMPVTMAAVGTHLARSDDHGASFSFVGDFFADVAAVDPGGSGENGRLSAETASLTSITVGSTTTWYGTHLHYFLRPITGYNPSYATGWTVQVAAATSPEALPTAASVTLGVTATSAGFSPSPQRLDQLAGLAQASCAMLNNPTLFARDDKLYLAVECLAFSGASMVPGGTTIQLFRTTPNGAPSAWTWAYAGELAGADLIARLGQDTIQQPDLSVAEDGTPILIVSPARKDSSTQVGTVPTGCVAIELASLDPPQLAQDCTGNLKIRERIEGDGFGACTHTAHSASGVVAVSEGASGGNWMLRASGAKP